MWRETSGGQRELEHSQQEAGIRGGDLKGVGAGMRGKKDWPGNRKLKGIKTPRDGAEELDGGLVRGRLRSLGWGSRAPAPGQASGSCGAAAAAPRPQSEQH